MIPNNKYYKQIAEILNDTEYDHFYSTLYYLKRIGQACGYTYTGFNPSNKYLKDWAEYETGETYTGHHINRYYLREIAEELVGSGSLTGTTENYYLSVIVENISPSPVSYTSIVASSDKSILSYADSEKATLYAQLKDNNDDDVALSGVTITFKKDNTTLGTADTDATGKATLTNGYTSSGVGDISITATDGTISSETYSIQDCYYYDSQTVDKQRYTVTSGGATISYSSDGVTITGTQATDSLVKNTALSLPNSYSAEVTLTKLSGHYAAGKYQYGGLCFDNCLLDMSSVSIDVYTLSPIASLTTINQGASQGDVLKIEMDNGTMKIYINDVLKTTQTISHTGIHQHRTYKLSNQNVGKSITAKDLKVKPL